MGCFKQTDKNIAVLLILSINFFFIFLNARKQNFMKNEEKLNLIGGACLCELFQ